MQTPYKELSEVFFALCKSIDTPKSLAAWLCYKSKSSDLFRLTIEPKDYDSRDAFQKDYLVVSFLSKINLRGWFTDLDDPRSVAIQRFATAEAMCLETNRRLLSCDYPVKPGVIDAISAAKRKISQTLGPLNVVEIIKHCRWGTGASATRKRSDSRPDQKLSTVPLTVTPSCLPYIKACIESDPHWISAICGADCLGPTSILPSVFEVLEYNRVTFVPKNAKTDRAIACEPVGNGYIQQGIGRYLRKRLKHVGINLDDQGQNQRLAQRGVEQDLATIDMSMASDTIAVELVYQLLPLEWALFLDRQRCRYGRLDDKLIKYNKFSSMGNAFTFELESLIFWALCSSVGRNESQFCSVYGDDVIVPSSSCNVVIDVLEYVGFTLNKEKSFIDGPFRESCGKHYFNGEDVTPAFQKDFLSFGDTMELIKCHNRLFRWGMRCRQGAEPLDVLNPAVMPAVKALRRFTEEAWILAHKTRALAFKGKLVRPFACYAPDNYTGDDALLSGLNEGLFSCDSHGTLRFERLVFTKKRRPNRQRAALQLWLNQRSRTLQSAYPANSFFAICDSVESASETSYNITESAQYRVGKLSFHPEWDVWCPVYIVE